VGFTIRLAEPWRPVADARWTAPQASPRSSLHICLPGRGPCTPDAYLLAGSAQRRDRFPHKRQDVRSDRARGDVSAHKRQGVRSDRASGVVSAHKRKDPQVS
jgi:hypothetical protein